MGHFRHESRLLQSLSQRGLIDQQDIDALPSNTIAVTLDASAMRWGPRLAALLEAGKISESDLLAIAAELKTEQDFSHPQSIAAEQTQGAILQVAAHNPENTAQELQAVADPDWDRYEVLELVGRGGMGAVYRAQDRRLGRFVALKFIRGGDQRLRQRFEQEARAQARIDHPNVCKVYEVGEVRNQVYIAMQFVDGLPLDKAAAAMSLHERVQVIRDAARALHLAHELGIVHRDIKPSNRQARSPRVTWVEWERSIALWPIKLPDYRVSRCVLKSYEYLIIGCSDSGISWRKCQACNAT